MLRLGAVAGGVIAGSIGALIWAGIAYSTGYEVGWVAWGVGGLVGLGVILGNGGTRSQAAGILAVVVTILALVAAKYTTVQLILADGFEIEDALLSGLQDDELVVSYMADEVVIEFMTDDKPVNWPAGVDPSQAATQVEYPADVWAIAQSRWDAMPLSEREDYRGELQQMVTANLALTLDEMRGEMAQVGFVGSFGLMDIIFFGLAVVTAFKMAAAKAEVAAAEQAQQPVQASEPDETRVA
jgi:hypothetical protein